MRTTWKLALGLLLTAGIAYAGTGQKEKRRDYRGVCWLLFYDKGIADELKLSPEMLEKAKQTANEVTDKYQDKLDEARSASKFGDDDKKWIEVVTEAARETDKALAKVLTAAQMTRLEQVHKQAYFYQTILDSKNAEVLKLTPEQQRKVNNLSKQGGPRMSLAEEKKWVDQGLAVLTPEQTKAWESIVGPRYTFRR